MLENHMVLNAPDAPWNQPDEPDFLCGCGQSYAHDVKRMGYAKWHSEHKFVEQCDGGEPEHRCCHDCAVTCRICGCHYCPEHRLGFLEDLDLCEECGAYYATFAPAMKEEAELLITIERRMMHSAGLRRLPPLDSEIDWLIAQLKEAWETIALHEEAITKERESCALVADALAAQWDDEGAIQGACIVADAIRARR